MTLKNLLKRSSFLMTLASFIYSFPVILINIMPILKGQILISKTFMRNVRIRCKGKNIRIKVSPGAILRNCFFYCKGDDIIINIEGVNTRINYTTFHCEDRGSCIIIKNGFSMEGGHIAATEGDSIEIGEDCMFSDDVEIRNGDSHSIWDQDKNRRINNAEKVIIGNHVWLCAHSRILKGSIIPDNCIIGNSAIVSKELNVQNSIYAGNPAKLIKNDIEWKRER